MKIPSFKIGPVTWSSATGLVNRANAKAIGDAYRDHKARREIKKMNKILDEVDGVLDQIEALPWDPEEVGREKPKKVIRPDGSTRYTLDIPIRIEN